MGYEINTTSGVELFLRTLDPAKVRQVYNGRSGCACGCRGTHKVVKDDPSTARRKINHMIRQLDRLDAEEGDYCGATYGHVFTEINGRSNIIYFED